MKIDAELMEKIWSDYKVSGSYSAAARNNGVSVYPAKKAVEKRSTLLKPERGSVLEYMEEKKKDACDFINKCMAIMADDEKLEKASINQIASAMGIVIEKFTKNLSESDTSQLGDILRAVQKVE